MTHFPPDIKKLWHVKTPRIALKGYTAGREEILETFLPFKIKLTTIGWPSTPVGVDSLSAYIIMQDWPSDPGGEHEISESSTVRVTIDRTILVWLYDSYDHEIKVWTWCFLYQIQGSVSYQPKQCTIMKEIHQNHHWFALFDPPKCVPFNDPWNICHPPKSFKESMNSVSSIPDHIIEQQKSSNVASKSSNADRKTHHKIENMSIQIPGWLLILGTDLRKEKQTKKSREFSKFPSIGGGIPS